MSFFFYRFYHITTAIKHWLFRRILTAGCSAMIAFVIASTMLMGSPIAPLYQLFSLILSLCSMALIWTCCRKGKLTIVRSIPRYATVGQPLRYEVMISNDRSLLRHWRLQETPPDPRPSATVYALSREPGELRRNAFDRFFGFHRWQWLLDHRKAFDGGQSEWQAPLAAAGSTRITITLTPRHRGSLLLDDMRLMLPDPFRFFQRATQTKSNADSLLVLPRHYDLSLPVPDSIAHWDASDDAVSSQKGHQGEFAGLREYRLGDPPRMIHHASWAKQGRPIVKESETLSAPRYAIVLDTFAPGQEVAFEEAVSIAASLIIAIHRNNGVVQRLFLGDQDHRHDAPTRTSDSTPFLEALARVQTTTQENFSQLQQSVLRHSPEFRSIFVIFTGWSASRDAFLTNLNNLGLATQSLCVAAHTIALPQRVHRVDPTRVQRDLQTLGS